MATELEVLKVRLEAMTSKYNKAMEDAAAKTKTSTGKIDKAMKTMILRFVGFAAAVMAARKAYRAFTAGMARVDKLAKTSKFLGITTEALAGLQHLSDLTGVSMGNLETAMMRMTRALGEAATGANEYLEPFQRIGVDVQKLLGLAPEKQMAAIANGIASLATPTEQGAIAMEIFGRSGMRMLNLLRQGEKGFEEAAAEAKRFGLAVSKIDAKKVEDANDAITRMKASLTGMTNALVVKFAPAIEYWATVAAEGFGQISAERQRLVASIDEVSAKTFAYWEQEGRSVMDLVSKYPRLTEGYALYLKSKRDLQESAIAAEVKAEADKQAALNSWTNQGIAQREAWEKMSNAVRVQTTIGGLSAMAAAWGEQSRTMFEWSKGLAMAEAAMNVFQGITAAWKLPPPYNAIQAGIIAATGAAQIANISATQFQKGGGGGGAAPAAGGGGAGAAAAAPAQTPLDVSISMQGSRFSDAEVRELIGAIDGQLADGVQMRSLRVT